MKSYSGAGLALLLLGASISIFAYYVLSNTPVVIFGLAVIVVAVNLFLLPEKLETSGVLRAMLTSATLPAEDLLEQIETKFKRVNPNSEHSPSEIGGRAIYLPPSDGRVWAFLPLRPNAESSDIQTMLAAPKFPSEALGSSILITPVGANVQKALDALAAGGNRSLDSLLNHLLVESSELCSSLKVQEVGNTVIIEMFSARIGPDNSRYSKYLGSIPCSLAASAIAAFRKRSVIITDERMLNSRVLCRFEVR